MASGRFRVISRFPLRVYYAFCQRKVRQEQDKVLDKEDSKDKAGRVGLISASVINEANRRHAEFVSGEHFLAGKTNSSESYDNPVIKVRCKRRAQQRAVLSDGIVTVGWSSNE